MFYIKEYYIPSFVTSIGRGAFSECSLLTKILIPLSVAEIDSYAFVLQSHSKTVFQVFTDRIINQIYKGVNAINGTYPGYKKLVKVASNVWEKVLVATAIVRVYGNEVLSVIEAIWKKMKSKREVRAATDAFTSPYLTGNAAVKIISFIPVFFEAEEFDLTPVDVVRLQNFFRRAAVMEEPLTGSPPE